MQKTEEASKLQNGDGSKEAAASAISEEKKKIKSRFMFNIADGGFTGAYPRIANARFLFAFIYQPSVLRQSSTPCGKTRSELPPSPRKPTRSGTVAMTTGYWQG